MPEGDLLRDLFSCPLLEAPCPRGEEQAVRCGTGYVETFGEFLCFRDYALRTCTIAQHAVTGRSAAARDAGAPESGRRS